MFGHQSHKELVQSKVISVMRCTQMSWGSKLRPKGNTVGKPETLKYPPGSQPRNLSPNQAEPISGFKCCRNPLTAKMVGQTKGDQSVFFIRNIIDLAHRTNTGNNDGQGLWLWTSTAHFPIHPTIFNYVNYNKEHLVTSIICTVIGKTN